VANYIKRTKEFAKKKGYVETEMGRRRYIPEINSPNFQVQNAAERMAINMPIQGMSADIVKLAMIEMHARYRKDSRVKILLQIHDEIIFEVSEEIEKDFSQTAQEIMEKIFEGKEKKFREELSLMTQPFVKDPNLTIAELINEKITKTGENIRIGEFCRLEL
jgi:DNA polymerase-1